MKALISAFVIVLSTALFSTAEAAESGVAVDSVGAGVDTNDHNQLKEHRSVATDHDSEPDCHILIVQVHERDHLVGKRFEKCD